jgi:hypothetical protein
VDFFFRFISLRHNHAGLTVDPIIAPARRRVPKLRDRREAEPPGIIEVCGANLVHQDFSSSPATHRGESDSGHHAAAGPHHVDTASDQLLRALRRSDTTRTALN